jgi:large subunit ribosomal protein L28
LKRSLLLALAKKDFLPNNAAKRGELLQKYQKHIIPLEEAEWYGLTIQEALEKLGESEQREVKAQAVKQPLKIKFREEFIQQLKAEQEEKSTPPTPKSSWNPFKFNKSV